ncbi:MAG: alpha/beta hydrolase family protein [Solirubrobacterales bacterium]
MGARMEAGAFAGLRLTVAAGLAIFAAVTCGCLALVGGATAGQVEIIEEEQLSERVIELTVDTPAFAAPTRLHVNLPTGYGADPDRRWPVTYFTAGTSNRYSAFNDSLGGEELTEDYPSILVSPDANSGYWSDWYNAGSFGKPMYETFVIRQLIPLIDARFRTIANRSHRVIFGISMGGYGAMMLAARHPDLFAAAATLSGAVDSNLPINGAVLTLSSTFDGAAADAIYGPRATQEIRWRGHNPTDLAGNLKGLALQVRTANGRLNPAIGEGGDPNDTLSCAVEAGVYGASTNLHNAFSDLDLPHVWQDYGDGCHSLQNFQREVVDTLASFEDTFSDPPSPPAEFNFRSIEPQFDIWNWRVAVDPDRALEFLRIRSARSSLTLEGSGQTAVTTPPRYRGVRTVDVNDRPKRVSPDGRLRFTVDLGRAHSVQQYTTGSATSMRKRTVSLKPHAVIRITRTRWTAGRLLVCAKAIGGTVPRARIEAGGSSAGLKVTSVEACRTLRLKTRPERVTVYGADGFGHPARTTARLNQTS